MDAVRSRRTDRFSSRSPHDARSRPRVSSAAPARRDPTRGRSAASSCRTAGRSRAHGGLVRSSPGDRRDRIDRGRSGRRSDATCRASRGAETGCACRYHARVAHAEAVRPAVSYRARDLDDIGALLEAGGDLEQGLRDAVLRDGGFSPPTLAWLLQSFPIERAKEEGRDQRRLEQLHQQLLDALRH